MIYFRGANALRKILRKTDNNEDIVPLSNVENEVVVGKDDFYPEKSDDGYYVRENGEVYLGSIQIYPEPEIKKVELVDFSSMKDRYEYDEKNKKFNIYREVNKQNGNPLPYKVDLTGIVLKVEFSDGSSKEIKLTEDDFWKKDCGRAGLFSNTDSDVESSPLEGVHYCYYGNSSGIDFALLYDIWNRKDNKYYEYYSSNYYVKRNASVLNIQNIFIRTGKIKLEYSTGVGGEYTLPFLIDFYFQFSKDAEYDEDEFVARNHYKTSEITKYNTEYTSIIQDSSSYEINISDNQKNVYAIAFIPRYGDDDNSQSYEHVCFFSIAPFKVSWTYKNHRTTSDDGDTVYERPDEVSVSEPKKLTDNIEDYTKYSLFDIYSEETTIDVSISGNYRSRTVIADNDGIPFVKIKGIDWSASYQDYKTETIAYLIGTNKVKF